MKYPVERLGQISICYRQCAGYWASRPADIMPGAAGAVAAHATGTTFGRRDTRCLPRPESDVRVGTSAEGFGQIWRGDRLHRIRRQRTKLGLCWLYLTGLKGLYSGEIVGYAIGERMKRHRVMHIVFRAVSLRRSTRGLIQHTGPAVQYCSHEYHVLVLQFGMLA